MLAWKKFRAAPHIVYLFLLEKQINTDSRNLMTIRKAQEVDSPFVSLSASACQHAPQATPSLELGGSDYGMIRLGCRLALGGIHFDCPPCRMQSGFLARRRKVIYRLKMSRLRLLISIRARITLALLDQRGSRPRMVFSRKHSARRSFIHC